MDSVLPQPSTLHSPDQGTTSPPCCGQDSGHSVRVGLSAYLISRIGQPGMALGTSTQTSFLFNFLAMPIQEGRPVQGPDRKNVPDPGAPGLGFPVSTSLTAGSAFTLALSSSVRCKHSKTGERRRQRKATATSARRVLSWESDWVSIEHWQCGSIKCLLHGANVMGVGKWGRCFDSASFSQETMQLLASPIKGPPVPAARLLQSWEVGSEPHKGEASIT